MTGCHDSGFEFDLYSQTMKKLAGAFLFLALLFSSCGKESKPAGEALSLELTGTDYKIISLALDAYFEPRDPITGDTILDRQNYYKLLISEDSTITDPRPYYGYVNPFFEITDSTGKPIRCSLKYKLDCSKISSFKVRTETDREKKEAYGSWEKFYKEIPDAYGLVYVARPSFYDEKQKASIYVEFYKHVKYAQGLHLIFKRGKDEWIFLKREQGWEN